MRSFSLAFLGAMLSCGVVACSSDLTDPGANGGDESALATDPHSEFYHLSEGSEFFPYFALRALRVTLPGGQRVPLLSPENLARYGFIADKASKLNPDALPIGITLARAPETGIVSLGVNCTACHVGKLEYQVNGAGGGPATKAVVIDGLPNMFDLKGFYGDVAAELTRLFQSPADAEAVAFDARMVAELAYVKLKYGDAEDNDFQWKMSLKDRFQVVWQLLVSSADAAGGGKTPEDIIAKLDLPPDRKRLLLARARFFQVVTSDPGGTPGGFGRADAFGTLKNQLFSGEGSAAQSTAPTDAPALFHIADREWFHANANTNSVLERNILQSLGVGGVVDSEGADATYVSTVNLANIHQLELTAQALLPPAWPSEVPRDASLAARGQDVYRATCASCHEPTQNAHGLYASKSVPLADIGTDPSHAVNFTAAVDGQTFVSRNGPMTEAIAKNYFDRNGISAEDQAAWSELYDAALNPGGRRSPPQWKADLVYMARPLDGVWATAPYLHNGSVPSIADLLEPAANRPKKFYLGHRSYDFARLGHVAVDGPNPAINATFLFDTSLPGNSNAGHEYGTALSAADKAALLEFLKGLGGNSPHPTTNQGR